MAHFKSERQFQTAVCNLALVNGWLVYNHPDSRKANVASVPGFPDIVLAKPGILLWIEAKMPGKKPSPAQVKWHEVLRSVGQTCVLAYPDDYEAIRAFIMNEPPYQWREPS